MEKELQKIYKQSKEDLEDKWFKFMETEGAKVKKMQEEYYELKKTGTPEEIKKKGKELGIAKQEMTLKNQYYKEMVDETTTKLAHTNEIAISYINGQMPGIYSVNYNDAYKDLVKGIKGISYNLVDESTVKYLVKNKKLQLPKKKVNIPKDKRWNAKQINSSILQGILQGEPIDKMAEIGFIPYDEPFPNELMYPSDPDGDPEEVYNCRCSMGARIRGWKKKR